MIRDCELWWLKKLVRGIILGHSILNHKTVLRQIEVCKRVGCTDKEIEDTMASALKGDCK
jgi:hypothetical protein